MSNKGDPHCGVIQVVRHKAASAPPRLTTVQPRNTERKCVLTTQKDWPGMGNGFSKVSNKGME